MRPLRWQPPLDLSTAEHVIVKRVRRAKLFVFLRHHRHALFTAAFQQELGGLYKDAPQGQPPVPPAHLARPSCAPPSIAARSGAPGGSKTPITSWGTPCARRWG